MPREPPHSRHLAKLVQRAVESIAAGSRMASDPFDPAHETAPANRAASRRSRRSAGTSTAERRVMTRAWRIVRRRSTSRSSNRKHGGSSAKTGRAGGSRVPGVPAAAETWLLSSRRQICFKTRPRTNVQIKSLQRRSQPARGIGQAPERHILTTIPKAVKHPPTIPIRREQSEA